MTIIIIFIFTHTFIHKYDIRKFMNITIKITRNIFIFNIYKKKVEVVF